MNEKLSAFVDNQLSELEERRLLDELVRSDELRARWGRYHLISAALRRELGHVVPLDTPAAIANALATEPRHRHGLRLAFSATKIAGGLAIAATVATVAVLNLPIAVTPEKQAATVAAAVPAPASSTSPRTSDATHPLNAYLLEHSEFAPTAGMGNMLPYVRSVNHDPNR
jgi:sigma-E factor negative regulatory protein RseA